MSEHPHAEDPDAAQEGAEESLLGDPDEAPDGPEERVSDMLERENEDDAAG